MDCILQWLIPTGATYSPADYYGMAPSSYYYAAAALSGADPSKTAAFTMAQQYGQYAATVGAGNPAAVVDLQAGATGSELDSSPPVATRPAEPSPSAVPAPIAVTNGKEKREKSGGHFLINLARHGLCRSRLGLSGKPSECFLRLHSSSDGCFHLCKLD